MEHQRHMTWKARSWKTMFETVTGSLSWMSQQHPGLSLKRNGVICTRDVAYKPTGQRAHRLDVYAPATHKPGDPPLPIVFYIHGGAFQMLSKETHQFAGSLFARRGFVLFNINYRLAPKHRYPAALQDTCDAFIWMLQHAHEYGGDTTEIVLTGESAGANLVTALTVAACYQRPEPWAQQIWQANPQLKASIPACGVLQVSDMERFSRRRPLPGWLQSRLDEVQIYLPDGGSQPPGSYGLADPLLVLEQAAPDRPLPPMLTFVGTKDPLLDDSRRLQAAVNAHGMRCDLTIYPGGIHAFHAFLWQQQARDCWRDTFRFLRDLPWKRNPWHSTQETTPHT